MEGYVAWHAGTIVGIALPLTLGVALSIVLTKRRQDVRVTAWPIAVGLILSVICWFGVMAVREQQAKRIEVTTRITGKAEQFANLSAALAASEKTYNDEIKSAMLAYYKSRGREIDPANMQVETHPPFPRGTFAVIETKISVPGKVFMDLFTGVHGNDTIEVDCISPSGRQFEVDLFNPKDRCGRMVKESIDMMSTIPVLSGKRPPGLQ